jgi:hypothetical protein
MNEYADLDDVFQIREPATGQARDPDWTELSREPCRESRVRGTAKRDDRSDLLDQGLVCRTRMW